MVAQFITAIESTISLPRLNRYTAINDDLDAVCNYFWNMALSEALVCTLNVIEISLRNQIHTTFSQWHANPAWFDLPNVLQRDELNAITRTRANWNPNRGALTPDRLVAELNFGFWTGLLGPRYQYPYPFWTPKRSKPLKLTFPHIPKSQRRLPVIHAEVDQVRRVRNRVFHHEPIFDRPALAQEHQSFLEIIAWMNPVLASMVQHFDRFPDVHANGRATVEATVRQELTRRYGAV